MLKNHYLNEIMKIETYKKKLPIIIEREKNNFEY